MATPTTPLAQQGILKPLPPAGRYLSFMLHDPAALPGVLRRLARRPDDGGLVLGLGHSLVTALGAVVPGLRPMPATDHQGIRLLPRQAALWCWLRGRDRGELMHRGRALQQDLAPALVLAEVVEGFVHGRGPNGHGLDLTGYEDGTENPSGRAARAAALCQEAAAGLQGSSFVAVQPWRHDFDAFARLGRRAQDLAIGRRRSDNHELERAPASAHVKRTAQEDFNPEAFLLRRSMPWIRDAEGGLMFVAFGRSFDAFEAQWRRMTGQEDGITDALFSFSRPMGGGYFWCPPVRDGRLDLSLLVRR